MIKHVITALVAGLCLWIGVGVFNSGRAWYQKWQAQQVWLAAHGNHEDHKQ